MNKSKAVPQFGRRYLAWIIFGFTLGIYCYLNCRTMGQLTFDELAVYGFVFLCFCGITLALICFISKGMSLPLSDFILIFAVIAGFILGGLRGSAFDKIQYKSLRDTAGSEMRYIGTVTDTPEPSSTGKTMGFPVKIMKYETDGKLTDTDGSIMLYTKPDLCRDISIGDVISFSAMLRQASDAPFDGGFSMRSYLYRQGLIFTAITDTPIEKTDITAPKDIVCRLTAAGSAVRSKVTSYIDKVFTTGNEEGGLLKGIMLGIRDSFSQEQYDNFSNSGLMHISAASGMHVMFLVGFITFFLRRLRISRLLRNLVIIPALIIFTAAAAFTPSVCRAFIMALMLIAASLFSRSPDPVTSVAAAAAVILAVNPYNLTSYSFILSFSAALGIIVFNPLFSRLANRIVRAADGLKPEKLQTVLKIFLQSAALSVSAQLGLIYFEAKFFNSFAYGSIIGNALIVPLASAAFVGGTVLWAVSFILPSVSVFISKYFLGTILLLINRIAGFFALPVFRAYIPTPTAAFFVPYLVLLWGIYCYMNMKDKKLTQC